MLRRYCLLALSIVVALAWMQISVAADNEADDDENETEEAIAFNQLPAAVQDAVKAAYPKAKIGKCVKETEEGEVVYEVALKSGKLEAELELDASGKILETETEEEIALDDLPDAVRDAVKKLVSGGTLLEAERITEEGVTTYEVEVKCGAVVLELAMDDSGKVLGIGVEDDDDHEGHDDDDSDDGDDDD